MSSPEAVTVWTTPNCVKCNATKRYLSKQGTAFTERALESAPEQLAAFKAAGHHSAPIVETSQHGTWSDLNLDKIRSLAPRSPAAMPPPAPAAGATPSAAL